MQLHFAPHKEEIKDSFRPLVSEKIFYSHGVELSGIRVPVDGS